MKELKIRPVKREINRKAMQMREMRIINAYAKYVIKKGTMNLKNEDYLNIGQGIIKSPSPDVIVSATKRTVRSNKDIANERIMSLMESLGVEEKKPIELLIKAEKIAEEKGNSGDLIKLADRYIELMNLKPKNVEVEIRETQNYKDLLPEELKKDIKIKREIDNDGN